MGVPNALVPAKPDTDILASQSKVGVPTAPVPTCVDRVTLASATTLTEPTDPVAERPVSTTGLGSPQVSDPQVPRPQPVIAAMVNLRYSYNSCARGSGGENYGEISTGGCLISTKINSRN